MAYDLTRALNGLLPNAERKQTINTHTLLQHCASLFTYQMLRIRNTQLLPQVVE